MRAAAFLTTLFHVVSDRIEARSEKGATAVEYGLLVGLIAVVLIVGITALGDNLRDMFKGLGETIGGVDTTGKAADGTD